MKKEIKKDIFFLFVVLVYSLQAILTSYSGLYAYVLGVTVSVALLYVIKNKYIATVAGLAVLAAMEFYNSCYKYLIVIAFLLICAHKNLLSDITLSDKNKKNETSGFSLLIVQICLLLSIALFVYSMVLNFEDPSSYGVSHLNRAYLIYFWLIGIFVYSLFDSRKNKKENLYKKNNKQLSSNLRFMYLVSIIAFSATVFFSCTKRCQLSFSHKAIFWPWFVFICSMFYNGDPYIESISEKIEGFLIKISSKSDKVKK